MSHEHTDPTIYAMTLITVIKLTNVGASEQEKPTTFRVFH